MKAWISVAVDSEVRERIAVRAGAIGSMNHDICNESLHILRQIAA